MKINLFSATVLSGILMMGCSDRNNVAATGGDEMSEYLMVFFSDDDHSLHFAISEDGYTFTALNDNRPVISGDTIAEQRGIRDPHIYRGPDGSF